MKHGMEQPIIAGYRAKWASETGILVIVFSLQNTEIAISEPKKPPPLGKNGQKGHPGAKTGQRRCRP
jgi:hypothetical protein